MRHILFGLSLAATAMLVANGASAEAVTGTDFSVVFPCKAGPAIQTVAAGKSTITVASHSCEKDGALYSVAVSSFPNGFIAKKTASVALAEAVNGAASNTHGKVRSDRPITLGKIAGHDAFIDVKEHRMAVHLRVFYVGDRQYQVMFLGPAGKETGKAATAFLDSFKLGK
jgi:hypothetical protein